MARISVKKESATKRQPKLASTLSIDEKYVGSEPIWDTERALTMSDADFEHHLRRSLRWYNYMFSSRELKKYVVEWLQENTKLDAREISIFVKSSDQFCPITVCSLVMAHRRGMPMKEKYRDYIIDTVTKLIDRNQNLVQAEPTAAKRADVKVPTIADRVAEKTAEYIGEVEGLIDDYIFNKKEFNLYNWLKERNVPQGSIVKFRQTVSRQQLEFAEALEGKDVQLKEGYRGFNKARLKQIVTFYEKLWADLDSFAQSKKVARKVRVKKSPSKDKLVAKLKYLKEDRELKITSINPVDIIGASKLWVYNTKTRKLYRYQADELASTLSIKGTTILGYDEVKSVGKTIRKPAEVLAKFMKASKVQLRKFLDDINAVEARANGRINEDTLLLKVE
jgi:hypothetical protein